MHPRTSLRSRARRWGVSSCLFIANSAVCFACASDPSSTAAPASARCATCHLDEFNAVDHPPHAGVRPTTCGTCHSEDSWHPFRLQHSYPLQGAHAKVDCFKCHLRFVLTSLPYPVFEGTPKQCVKCHEAAHEKANQKVKNHPAFPDTCERCHSVTAWKPTLPHEGQPPSTTDAPIPSAAPPSNTKRTPLPTHVQRKPAATPAPKPAVITPTPAPTRKPDRISGASTTK